MMDRTLQSRGGRINMLLRIVLGLMLTLGMNAVTGWAQDPLSTEDGPSIQALLSQALEASSAEDWKKAEDLLTRRFAIVQVWRAIRNPIESDPLGICDARTLSPEDLVVSERRYPDRVGQTYQIAYNAKHEWYYFPRMARDEALVFKVFDSATDGRARFTAHSAFADPTSAPDAAPRESIEMRTIAFF